MVWGSEPPCPDSFTPGVALDRKKRAKATDRRLESASARES